MSPEGRGGGVGKCGSWEMERGCFLKFPLFYFLKKKKLFGCFGGSDGKESACNADPWVRKIPWRREWQPTPVFLPGEFHGQSTLMGYSPWGCKEWDMTERLTHTFWVLVGCSRQVLS